MEYRLVRSKRKTLCIEVQRDGTVLVRSPFFLPQKRIEAFLKEKEAWILRQQEKQKNRPDQTLSEGEIALLRERAKAELIPRAWDMAKEFGFAVKSVRITAAKSRFGSCSAENGICLSLFLMQYPREAQDYVILHELCHTVEHNHSPRFYALLDRYMPDHPARRALLRK